ncbi:MAG: GNAT family N-acetyltransferase [Solobacterium sp.]|nr:GNAT family N-acetyltransferase [Solobacterium sp.]
MSIQLVSWHPEMRQELQDLYAAVDQSFCLVQLPVPLQKPQTDAYLEGVRTGQMDGNPFHCFAVMKEDELIGKIELTVQEDRFAELDVILKKEMCGKGYGKQAVSAMIGLAARKQWCRGICAYTVRENLAMQAVLVSAGFQSRRSFTADVIVPNGSSYYLRQFEGIEYVRMITWQDREL